MALEHLPTTIRLAWSSPRFLQDEGTPAGLERILVLNLRKWLLVNPSALLRPSRLKGSLAKGQKPIG
jgi:hypothetical protein